MPTRRAASPTWRRRGNAPDVIVARMAFFLMLAGAIACFAAYAWTSQPLWRQRGLTLLKWTLLIAGLFFAGLIAQRLVEMA